MNIFKIDKIPNSISFGLNTFLGLISFWLLVHSLDAASYGLWSLIGSIFAFLSVLDFGLNQSIIKYLNEYRGNERNEFLKTIFSFYLILTIIVNLAISIYIFVLLPEIQNTYTDYHYNALIIGINIFYNLRNVYSFTKNILDGIHKYETNNRLILLNYIFQIIILSLIIKNIIHGDQLVYLFYYLSIPTAISIYMNYRTIKINNVYFFDIKNIINIYKYKNELKISLTFQSTTILGSLPEPLLKYTLYNFIGIDIIKPYDIAKRIYDLLWGAVVSMARPITPNTALYYSGQIDLHNYNIIKKRINKTMDLFVIYFIIIGSPFFLFMIMSIFNNPNSVFIFTMFIPQLILQILSLTPFGILMARGLRKSILNIQILSFLLNGIFASYFIWIYPDIISLSIFILTNSIVFICILLITELNGDLNIKQYLKYRLFKNTLIFIVFNVLIFVSVYIFNINMNYIILFMIINMIIFMRYRKWKYYFNKYNISSMLHIYEK